MQLVINVATMGLKMKLAKYLKVTTNQAIKCFTQKTTIVPYCSLMYRRLYKGGGIVLRKSHNGKAGGVKANRPR